MREQIPCHFIILYLRLFICLHLLIIFSSCQHNILSVTTLSIFKTEQDRNWITISVWEQLWAKCRVTKRSQRKWTSRAESVGGEKYVYCTRKENTRQWQNQEMLADLAPKKHQPVLFFSHELLRIILESTWTCEKKNWYNRDRIILEDKLSCVFGARYFGLVSLFFLS